MKYADLHEMTEDERIDQIVAAAKKHLVAFIVDDMPKAERYIKKIQIKDKTIRVVEKLAGVPIKNAVTVKVTGATVN